jgi:hypothetical protein
LVGFGYHETNFRKLTEINGAFMGGKRPLPGQPSLVIRCGSVDLPT